jgi:hypothetical protein
MALHGQTQGQQPTLNEVDQSAMTNSLNRVKRASGVNFADEVVEGEKAGTVKEVRSNRGCRRISVVLDVTRGWYLGTPILSVKVLV